MWFGGLVGIFMNKLKSFMILGYFGIGIIYALYQNFFGKFHYKSLAYHIGKGLVWPASMFPSFGKAVGALIIIGIVFLLTVKR